MYIETVRHHTILQPFVQAHSSPSRVQHNDM
jgi:hypothetical protein